ncbi:zinc-dependent alcohol dehydrogenase [Micromonospora globbae]|uniref:zinc-dependent alcohol dehydrogenase n=1 Tax=Micromonospora globbae TaxID=1894969 RepID=UPI00341384FF
MQAMLFPGDRTAVIEEVTAATPGPGEARIRVVASGVCGSDLHRYRLDAATRRPARGMVTGHEAVGVVDAVGPNVSESLLGQRVVVYHVLNCALWDRNCGNGCAADSKRCTDLTIMGVGINGGNAQWQIVPASLLMPVPEWMTHADAVAAVCNFGTAWSGVRALGVGAEPVAVWGLGPVGLAAALLAMSRGARVVGLDPSPQRRGVASQLGVADTADPTSPDIHEQVRELLGERPTAQIDASGSPAAHRAMVAAAPHRGRLGLLGMGAQELALPFRDVMLAELVIRGVFLFDKSDWPAICADCATYDLQPQRIITARCPWWQAPELVRRADLGEVGKVLIQWTDPEEER